MDTLRREQGFTLIELLVVIVIVGILASIGIPAYFDKRHRALDVQAKSNARNLVTHMELCLVTRGTYTGCVAALPAESTGLPIGTGIGEVTADSESPNGYRVVATSRSTAGGSNHVFYIDHTVGGTYVQTCTPPGFGGCSAAGDW